MKKYIRTKDGRIFDTRKYTQICILVELLGVVPTDQIEELKKEWFKKQADTIEELCDEFVIAKPNKKPFITNFFINEYKNKAELDFKKAKNITIYGAIWNDKGLIYVAKMNDKGDFELI